MIDFMVASESNSYLEAFLQYTLKDRQGLTRLNIIARVWTGMTHLLNTIIV